MDQDQPLVGFRHALQVFQSREDRLSGNGLLSRQIAHPHDRIHRQREEPAFACSGLARGPGHDELVGKRQIALRKAESSAKADNRDDQASQVDDSDDNGGRFRQGGDINRVHDSAHRRQMYAVKPLVKGENDALSNLDPGLSHLVRLLQLLSDWFL